MPMVLSRKLCFKTDSIWEENILKIALTVVFIIISVVLSIIVLMQEGKENGLNGTMTGTVDSYWSRNKKHSKDAVIQRITVVLGALFIIIAALLSSKWM